MKSEDDTISFITIPNIHGCDIIKPGEIVYIKGEGNQSAIYLADKPTPVIASACISHYAEILSPVMFMQIHRSYIINLDYLVKYLKGKVARVILKKGIPLPVSDDFKDTLEDFLYGKR